MKFYLSRLSIAVIALFALILWDASLTNASMTNSTLTGIYIQCEYGTDPNPWASSFEISFDGAGTATGCGKTISYSVGSDGSVIVNVDLEGSHKGVVSADGSIYVIVDDDDNSTGDQSIHVGMKKSSGLTTATLTGTYIQCEYGTDPNPWASSFEVSFNGAGTATGGGKSISYSVGSDGSVDVGEIYKGVVSANGDIYVIVDDRDNSTGDQSIHVGIRKTIGYSINAMPWIFLLLLD